MLSLLWFVSAVFGTPPGPETVHNEAGYIDLLKPPRKFFYWFFESRNDPENDPFIVWMSGGPGCSSQLALYAENGPYKVTRVGGKKSQNFTVALNPYSWNSNATVLWIDQPAGAGFSEGTPEYNSTQVGETVYEVMTKFFKDHQKYAKLPFYIFGESYAGHYVPAVAHKILTEKLAGNSDINMQGIAIGNGLTDPGTQFGEYPVYAKEHNLVKKAELALMEAAVPVCKRLTKACNNPNLTVAEELLACENAYTLCAYGELLPIEFTGINLYDVRKQCGSDPLCYDFSAIVDYLNVKEVQEALGVKKHFADCNRIVDMEFVFGGDWMHDWEPSVVDLLENNMKVLIYAGEWDYICNWRGNYAWLDQMSWTGQSAFKSATNATWTGSDGSSAGGFLKSSKNLSFLKVIGAGHLAPMDQPENLLKMVQEYTKGSLQKGKTVKHMGI